MRRRLALYRRLRRLLLPATDAEYGEEMDRVAGERIRGAGRRGGPAAAWAAWAGEVVDLVRAAAARGRHRSARGRRSGRGGAGRMDMLTQDVRYALRRLAATPFFTATAVAILAVGIGVNAAAFGLVDALLFRPAPFEDPEEIVAIYQDSDDGEPTSTSFPAYRDMAAMTDVFAGVAATSSASMTWETSDGPRPASVEFATASYLPVLGLSPSLGRWFEPAHDVPGAGHYAVVSHRTWRTALAGDPDVVGSTVRLNGQPVTVIGVGPRDFNGPAGAVVTDFWLSISTTPVGGAFRVANLDRREDHWYDVRARLAPGVTVERARQAMDRLAARLAEAFPEFNRGRGITLFAHDEVRLHPRVDGQVMGAGVGIMVVVALVLLLTCSNLANLLLVRGIDRSPEMAVRKALGASGGRVARLFVVESLLLSATGGIAGVLLAGWLMGVVPAVPGLGSEVLLDLAVDRRVVLFATGLALLTGVVFGVAPAVGSAKVDVAGAMREEQRSASAGRSAKLLRGGLVMVQVAVSLVLVVGAGLMARSLANVRGVDPGVDADRLAVVSTSFLRAGVEGEEAAVLSEEILRRIEALPGVDGAAMTSRLPVQPGGTTTTVVEGYTPPGGTEAVELAFGSVSPDYFRVVGVPLVDGRSFGPDDVPGGETVVMVNRTAAERFWDGDAVGRRLRGQGSQTWRRVIGVVEDTKVSRLEEPPTPMMYVTTRQVGISTFGMSFVARTGGDPAALVPGLRRALSDARSSLSPTRLGTMASLLGDALSGPRTAAAVMGAFSLLALLLASLGVYAVVSFAVARRAGEMGIRVALGAARGRLVGMVVREALVVVALGLAVGLVVAFLVAPALEGMLFGVGSLDPATFVGSGALLLAVAALAAWLPARRAAAADPVESLRAQ